MTLDASDSAFPYMAEGDAIVGPTTPTVYDRDGLTIHIGDAGTVMGGLPRHSVDCAVTSPPYYNLRNYGIPGEIGSERTPDEYVANVVAVLLQVRPLLRERGGVLWLNLGDTYGPRGLLGIPWRVALALQDGGWTLRQEMIWAKPDPLPESVRNRPTRSHEQVFMLTTGQDYWWDPDANREPWVQRPNDIKRARDKHPGYAGKHGDGVASAGVRGQPVGDPDRGRNWRSVLTVKTSRSTVGHRAVYPPDLIRPMVLASCPPGGVVLDPFAGSGTTGMVALASDRRAVLIDVNAEYLKDMLVRTGRDGLWSA
jgi:DNA modification methylase